MCVRVCVLCVWEREGSKQLLLLFQLPFRCFFFELIEPTAQNSFITFLYYTESGVVSDMQISTVSSINKIKFI